MNNELFRSVAASTIFYEIENETTNESISVESFENCIKLYEELCNGEQNAVNRVLDAIESDKDNFYFYEEIVEIFLEKYGNNE